MLKKIALSLIIVIVIVICAGLAAANFLFDKYLAQPEVIEELIAGMEKDIDNFSVDKENSRPVNDITGGKLPAKIEDRYKDSKAAGIQAEQPSNMQKNTEIKSREKFQKNQMENIDKSKNMDNNVKKQKGKICIDPADKVRIIEILKSSLSGSDIQELKQIASSKPLTSDKIARVKSILKMRLSREQKNELKEKYRKYYGR